jgi:hypothetical protein
MSDELRMWLYLVLAPGALLALVLWLACKLEEPRK